MAKKTSTNKSSTRSRTMRIRIADFVASMEVIAPSGLAQEWDNVGLLVGDPAATLKRVLLCIDLTRAVVDEAIQAYQEAVRLDPQFADAHFNLAVLFEQRDERELAVEHMAIYREVSGDADLEK